MRKQLVTALLVPVGVVTGHALGYLVFDPLRHGWQPTFVTHGVYPTLVAAALLVAFAVGWWVAVTRTPIHQLVPSTCTLAAAQVAALVCVEGAELLVVGEAPSVLLHQPALWLVLAGQLAAAALIRASLHSARRGVVALRSRSPRAGLLPRSPAARSVPAEVPRSATEVHTGSLSRRGAPVPSALSHSVIALG